MIHNAGHFAAWILNNPWTLAQVVMLNSQKSNNKSSVLTSEDIAWQEQRRKRKVRELDFEIK